MARATKYIKRILNFYGKGKHKYVYPKKGVSKVAPRGRKELKKLATALERPKRRTIGERFEAIRKEYKVLEKEKRTASKNLDAAMDRYRRTGRMKDFNAGKKFRRQFERALKKEARLQEKQIALEMR